MTSALVTNHGTACNHTYFPDFDVFPTKFVYARSRRRRLTSHGLLDVRVPSRAPDLIGSWLLDANGAAGNSGDGRFLENDVFTATAKASSGASDRGDRVRMMRLPPARVGGALEVTPCGPLAPRLNGGQEVWGFSLRVSPRFPSDFDSAHPWLRRRFEAFAALVWGEQGQAQAVNAQLIRCLFF